MSGGAETKPETVTLSKVSPAGDQMLIPMTAQRPVARPLLKLKMDKSSPGLAQPCVKKSKKANTKTKLLVDLAAKQIKPSDPVGGRCRHALSWRQIVHGWFR